MTQDKLVQAPAPAPAPPAVPGVTIVTPQALVGPPTTAAELRALKARRSELSDQLNSAVGRRRDVARQLQSATGADRTGLEQRLGVLDARIARLEASIDETGQQLASVPVELIGQQERTRNSRDTTAMNIVPILVVFTIFVLCPIAIAAARAIWKRGSMPRALPDRDTQARLERMEQAMDAIAIEIERVSEGQRFVTRLMSDGRTALPVTTNRQGEQVG